ncbi:MAG: PaaI family thioesterase [candidate division Zixibacteria bacterium]|nr:PaaI family thioesterase [candidate division Zixibacteria bacterium]
MTFQPQNNNYREAVRALFESIPIHNFLDITLDEIEPGFVSAYLPKRPELLQQHGYFQAGALVTLADAVAGAAAYSLMNESENLLSVNFAVSLLRPAKADKIRGEGRVIKAGKRLYFCEAVLFNETGEKREKILTATVTLMVV